MALSASEVQYEQAHIKDNATDSIIAANIICVVVASCAISLRLVSRRLRRLSLGIDDYLAILAMLFVVAFLASTFIGLHLGSGKHTILSKDPGAFAKVTLASQVIYSTGVVPIKLSLIFLYRRIFPNRSLHIALCVVGGVVVCMGIAADVLAIFKCLPVKAIWYAAITNRCINFDTWTTIYSAQNVITDFVLLCLPLPLVWGLHVTTVRKVQVSGILALGSFASVASIIRIPYIRDTSAIDATWADVGIHTWSMVELCMGITSICLPTLGPIFSHFRQSPSTAHGTFKRANSFWQGSPNSIGKKTASLKRLWTGLKMLKTEGSKDGSPFTELKNSQDNIERDWTAIAPFTNTNDAEAGGVEVNFVRCSSASHDDESFDGIKVTTDMQQIALKST